ncbi:MULTISPECIES: type 2 lanthipeptide synthetase LanM family protein [unclassified Nostoc]|uniref:type 2 lanthipeptide synthetase LanM family protein n=1 Tax=unclassified Nostoc TaxID=2593658 RepID=UPI001D26E761|nr:type 2 lanthipeptide synthetase LanM family protein [Nostoc sp. JL23]MBN3880134.1 type 2 lantipeptide synthetase LanM [Nostoc sp. JL23]
MQISQEDLIKIVEQASTINERLGTEFLLNQISGNDNVINSRIESWCQVVAQGNQEQFEKRLAWDGLDLNTIRQVLGSVYLADQQNLPAWAETLKAVLEATALVSLESLEKGLSQEENSFLNPQELLPFEELFLSFVHIARHKLSTQAGSSYCLLSTESHATLERSLIQSLTSLCSQAMGEQFLVFRTHEQPSLIRWLGQLQGSHSREQYSKFIRRMLDGGLLEFFQEYSMLARLVATVTDFWVNNTSEFLQRLASDWLDIQTTFQGEVELGEVVTIESGLSDLHEDGRSVIAVTFASGLKLIYKPKDCASEEAYFQLLAWLNERGVPLPFKLVQVLNRSTHGWVEYVRHLPCKDKQTAVRYYQRAGMLLSVLYALEGTDCHSENIIACGEHPVLIDMETLMAHRVREIESPYGVDEDALSVANEQFTYSVLRTNFLPKWQVEPDGLVYDISGLGGVEGQMTHFCLLKWQHINTDGMVLGYESFKTRPKANVASLDGVNLSPSDYVEELVDGFRRMYQFLMAHREALLATNGPLTKFADQRVRFIFRPTQVYGSVLKEALQTKFLRNGVDRSIALDVLSKSLLKSETKPHCWPIIAAEKKALIQLDIPLFATRSNSDDLKITPNETIKQYFTEPSYNLVIVRLHQLHENDLEQQISLIRSSLYALTANESDRSSLSVAPELNLDAVTPLTQDALVQQAVEIAQQLRKRSLGATDGSVTWMGLDYIREAQRFQLKPMSYDLYDGSYGVVLFLAALEKFTGGAVFRDLALGALQPLHKLLQDLDPDSVQKITKQIGIGGGKGFGSILYALVRSSQFLAEPILLKDAQQIASLITPALIALDRKFDIMSGSAGAILGLLTLHQATANPAVLEQAITCGHHLLNHRTASNAGLRAWATLNGKLLTGFSHGASGVAYSLLRLYETTQDKVFKEAATEAIAYERSVFSPIAQNWPDFRSEKPEFLTSWCHGAPGIGFARLGSLAILDTDEIRQEIEIALQTTQKFGMHEIDHLCCGNFGRIEVLLIAAQQLGRSEFSETAQKQAAWVVKRAENTGSFQIFPNLFRGTYNPGFFQGAAGIGYELLRLAYPDSLPSVLLWK